MKIINLTPAMRRALEAIDKEGDKRLHLTHFYRAMGISNRGRYLVKSRMEDANLIAMTGSSGDIVTITFAGIQALKAAA